MGRSTDTARYSAAVSRTDHQLTVDAAYIPHVVFPRMSADGSAFSPTEDVTVRTFSLWRAAVPVTLPLSPAGVRRQRRHRLAHWLLWLPGLVLFGTSVGIGVHALWTHGSVAGSGANVLMFSSGVLSYFAQQFDPAVHASLSWRGDLRIGGLSREFVAGTLRLNPVGAVRARPAVDEPVERT